MARKKLEGGYWTAKKKRWEPPLVRSTKITLTFNLGAVGCQLLEALRVLEDGDVA